MTQPELLLLAPRADVDASALTAAAVARCIGTRRPGLVVRVTYRQHGWPGLVDAVDRAAVGAAGSSSTAVPDPAGTSLTPGPLTGTVTLELVPTPTT